MHIWCGEKLKYVLLFTCNHFIQVTPWLHVVIKVYIVTFVGLNLIGGGKITLGSCFFKISRSLPCLAPKQVKRLSLGIDFNSKNFSNVILKHPLTFSASILNFWCRIMLVIEVLVIDVPCKLSSRSLLHLWTSGDMLIMDRMHPHKTKFFNFWCKIVDQNVHRILR